MNDVNVVEPTLVNFFLVLSPYIFGFLVFNRTAEIGKSLLLFIISAPISYSLIYYLNDIPF